MHLTIPLPVAFAFCSLCFGGILFLRGLLAVVGRNPGAVDETDGWLIWFYSLLLAVAALLVLWYSIFG